MKADLLEYQKVHQQALETAPMVFYRETDPSNLYFVAHHLDLETYPVEERSEMAGCDLEYHDIHYPNKKAHKDLCGVKDSQRHRHKCLIRHKGQSDQIEGIVQWSGRNPGSNCNNCWSLRRSTALEVVTPTHILP